ncbi:MAG: gluconate 2-dehydrogenase subunit 3 family protein [Pedobacter sp.]|nr:MAG: gluconate 2-dehydrogenase subunit 3 family protein [Pedobacter sp.]
MNRRTTIKALLGIGLVTAIYPLYKYVSVHAAIDRSAFFDRRDLIAELAETIIPATETPGAKDAKVQDFIIKMLIDCTPITEQNIFLEGLNDVEKYCVKNYNKTFIQCSLLQRIEVLTDFEDRDSFSIEIFNRLHKKLIGESFFRILKNLTIEGYCTSELGATKGLAYDYIPGKYEACIPLQPNQKSWATK